MSQDMSREAYEAQLKLGEAMLRLQDNEDFQLVFEDKFTVAFAVTNVMNLATYNPERKSKCWEKMNARGVFHAFINQTLDDANNAAANLASMDEAEDTAE
jgi:hypothetical protein